MLVNSGMTEPLIVTLAGRSLVRGFEDKSPLQGNSNRGNNGHHNLPAVHKWLAIPYGRPTRWEVIKDTPEWDGLLECTEFGPRPTAVSSGSISPLTTGSRTTGDALGADARLR
jgi:hypothetical protein